MNPLALIYASAQLAATANIAALSVWIYAWSPGPHASERKPGEANVVPLERKRA